MTRPDPIRLGVNIDHVATLRQARGGSEPDPVHALFDAIGGGADGITIHLREDRRHIGDRDLRLILELSAAPVNLEMASTPEMTRIACAGRPASACLVPERREERTTEGGLDVAGGFAAIAAATAELRRAGIRVSHFIEADPRQIEAAARAGADMVEFHTGRYAHRRGAEREAELARIAEAVDRARAAGLIANAGHGLDYLNVAPIAAIPGIHELNIGHSIVSRAVFTGLRAAVAEMKRIMKEARGA